MKVVENNGSFIVLDGVKLSLYSDNNVISAKRLIELCDLDLVRQYKNNRGKQAGKNKLNKRHIHDIATNLHIPAIDVIGLREALGDDHLVINNGHHRIEAIRLYFKLNPEAEDFNVRIRIVSLKDGMTYHRYSNNTLKHTTNNNLTNPDYSLGNKIIDILEKYGLEQKKAPQLGNVMLAYGLFGEEISFSESFKKRTEVKDMADCIGGEDEFFRMTHLTTEKVGNLMKAIEYYCEYFKSLESGFKVINGKIKVTQAFKDLKKSSPFFSVMIIDLLRKKHKFCGRTPKELSDRTFNNLGSISEQAKMITHSGKNKIESTVSSLCVTMNQEF